MSKLQARKIHKRFRKQGIPFILSAKISRLVAKGTTCSSTLLEKLQEFSPEVLPFCPCCGPDLIRFRIGDNAFQFSTLRNAFI